MAAENAQDEGAHNVSVEGLLSFATALNKGVFVWDHGLRLIGLNQLAADILQFPLDLFPLGSSYGDVTMVLHRREQETRPDGFWPRLPITDLASARALVASDPKSFATVSGTGPAGAQIKRLLIDDRFMLSVVIDLEEMEVEHRKAARDRAYLSTTLENMNDGAMLVDEADRIISCNRRMFELYGVDPDLFTEGMSAADFIGLHGDLALISDVEARQEVIAQRVAVATGRDHETGNFQIERRLITGTILEVQRTALPRGAGVMTVRDVTESAQLARQRQMFRTVLDNIDEGVTLIEKDGTVAVVNDQMTGLYDIEAAKVEPGMHIQQFAQSSGDLKGSPPEEFEREVRNRVAFATSELPGTVSRTRDLKNGRTLHISRTALDDGGAVATYRDITKETERRRLLEEAKAVAEEANLLKSDFVAKVTHDLRTPMNGVLGMASLLERTGLEEHQLRLLEVLKRSGQHMVDLIDDLLTVATLESGGLTIDPEPLCLESLGRHCVEMMRPRAEDRGLLIDLIADFEGGRDVMGDETRLTQLIINLLNNAVKFTEAGQVTLRMRTTCIDGEVSLCLQVEDTGVGIPEQKLDAVFEKFAQLGGRAHKQQEGVGLGLSICRALTLMMEGTLTATSEEGVGSVFTLRASFPSASSLRRILSA